MFWAMKHRWILLVSTLVIAACINPANLANRDGRKWIGTWAAAPQPPVPGRLTTFHNQTVRLIVHTTAAGSRARVRISNTFGDRPIVVGAAHLARRINAADVDLASALSRERRICIEDPQSGQFVCPQCLAAAASRSEQCALLLNKQYYTRKLRASFGNRLSF